MLPSSGSSRPDLGRAAFSLWAVVPVQLQVVVHIVVFISCVCKEQESACVDLTCPLLSCKRSLQINSNSSSTADLNELWKWVHDSLLSNLSARTFAAGPGDASRQEVAVGLSLVQLLAGCSELHPTPSDRQVLLTECSEPLCLPWAWGDFRFLCEISCIALLHFPLQKANFHSHSALSGLWIWGEGMKYINV